MKAFKELKYSTKVIIALVVEMLGYAGLAYLMFGVIKNYKVTFIIEIVMLGICWIAFILAVINIAKEIDNKGMDT